jgi:hypothetical protein
MDIAVTITNTTARQDAKLAEFLADLNVQRQGQGLPPYATVQAWAVAELEARVAANIRSFEVIEANIVKEAYIAAGNATQSAVRTALGL